MVRNTLPNPNKIENLETIIVDFKIFCLLFTKIAQFIVTKNKSKH